MFKIKAAFVAAFACIATLFVSPAGAATATVDYPFNKDSIPIYSGLGVTGTVTAAHRWEVGTGIDLVRVYSDPAAGINVRWSSARAGTTVGGWVNYNRWAWDGSSWEAADCTVFVNTNVAGYGRPSGKWLQAIVSHEVGHCLGWYDHGTYPSIMRTSLNPSRINAGLDPYTPTTDDLNRIRYGYQTN